MGIIEAAAAGNTTVLQRIINNPQWQASICPPILAPIDPSQLTIPCVDEDRAELGKAVVEAVYRDHFDCLNLLLSNDTVVNALITHPSTQGALGDAVEKAALFARTNALNALLSNEKIRTTILQQTPNKIIEAFHGDVLLGEKACATMLMQYPDIRELIEKAAPADPLLEKALHTWEESLFPSLERLETIKPSSRASLQRSAPAMVATVPDRAAPANDCLRPV